jgi:hypothetical protein
MTISRVTPKEVGQKLFQCHFAHFKSDMKSVGIELEPARREDSAKSPWLWHLPLRTTNKKISCGGFEVAELNFLDDIIKLIVLE